MAKIFKKTSVLNQEEKFGIPVVAVLGHVDHGKTSLLDAIRKTNVASGEHGGITQKIGATEVEITHENKKRRITFIDTPGHEAFSRMRIRGTTAADIGILVVSSVDGVKPQTKESIQHLKAASVPFIVVMTKADLANKNPEKVIGELAKEEVSVEGRGGDVPFIEVSAATGTNISELLELILILYDVKVVPAKKEEKKFYAIIIESKKDMRKGVLTTIIIKNGEITIKDDLISGTVSGKVKALITDSGQHIQKASTGMGVEVLGFEDMPVVGEAVYKKAEAQIVVKENVASPVKFSEETLFLQEDKGQLSIIVCADTLGSLEAILASLPEAIKIILRKTGEVSEADVFLAKSTGAIVVSFNTKIRNDVMRLASLEKVLVKNYTIIYELIDEIMDAMEGKKLSMEEQIYGSATILALFPFEKTKVLGIKVTDGRIARGDKVRILRGEEIVGESTIISVRQGKEQISKVEKGKECGIIISPFLDFTIGDMVLCHG